ncbi:MAG: hypothetical protein R3F13_16925 [Prosthecobacter sp.]
MKSILTLLVASFLSATAAQARSLAGHLVVQAMKVSGREALEVGAREAMERAAANAIRVLGGEAAEKIVQRGGLELLEASLHYGDDILRHAARVTDAARYLGMRPQEGMSLVARLGDDALLLEARTPGMAEKAATLLGRGALAPLSKAPAEEVTRLVGYAARAESNQIRATLLDGWQKHGVWILNELDKRKSLILTGGLTASMLVIADGGHDMLQDIPEKAPQLLAGPANTIATGINTGIVILSARWVWRY